MQEQAMRIRQSDDDANYAPVYEWYKYWSPGEPNPNLVEPTAELPLLAAGGVLP